MSSAAGDRCDLLGGPSSRGDVCGREDHVDLGGENAESSSRLARLVHDATDRGARGIAPALREPQQREAWLRCPAGFTREAIRLLGLGGLP